MTGGEKTAPPYPDTPVTPAEAGVQVVGLGVSPTPEIKPTPTSPRAATPEFQYLPTFLELV